MLKKSLPMGVMGANDLPTFKIELDKFVNGIYDGVAYGSR